MQLTLTRFFNNPSLSDVVIKQIYNGETREYYAHKAVLCMNSEYFIRAFTGEFMVRDADTTSKFDKLKLITCAQEAATNVMELHDDNPDDFKALPTSMYANESGINDGLLDLDATDQVETFARLMGIYVVADKYAVARVSTAAVKYALGLIEQLSTRDLIPVIKAYYNDNVEVDSMIGRAITEEVLYRDPEIMPTAKFEELLPSYPTFGADVALAFLRNPGFARERRACTNSDCSHENIVTKDMLEYVDYDCICGHPFEV